MKRGALLIIFCLLATAVTALPTLDFDNKQPADWQCSNYRSAEKTFDAKFSTTKVGLVCGEDAFIKLYECLNTNCNQRVNAGEAYKVNYILPQFVDYTVKTNYHYQCYICKNPADNIPPEISGPTTIMVEEGETVELNANCTDPENDVVSGIRYNGWMNSQTKTTTYTDEGNHKVTLICEDEFQGRTEKVVQVIVKNNNRAPQILTINQR